MIKALRPTLLRVLAALVLAWAGGRTAVAADPRIDLVERGLVGKFYLAGRPLYTLAERMRFYHVPAVSIAVVDDYSVAWARAYGVRDVAFNSRAKVTTLFQAASMSKPVAAAAILRLFEERSLSLDADVNTMRALVARTAPTRKHFGTCHHAPTAQPQRGDKRQRLRRLRSGRATADAPTSARRNASSEQRKDRSYQRAGKRAELLRRRHDHRAATRRRRLGRGVCALHAANDFGSARDERQHVRTAIARIAVVVRRQRVLLRRKTGPSWVARLSNDGGGRAVDDRHRPREVHHRDPERTAGAAARPDRRVDRTRDDDALRRWVRPGVRRF